MSRIYARLNPYATHRVHALSFRQTGFSWPKTLSSLTDMMFTGAVIGAKGSGKTTFLGELESRLNQLGYQTLAIQLRTEHTKPQSEVQRHLDTTPIKNAIILIDGAEQLGFWGWRRFLLHSRDRKGLVITTHGTGRLKTLIECHPTFETLNDLVRELDPRQNDTGLLRELFDHFSGNIRLCLRALYDQAGTIPRAEP